jgi:predicted dehydrogenase
LEKYNILFIGFGAIAFKRYAYLKTRIKNLSIADIEKNKYINNLIKFRNVNFYNDWSIALDKHKIDIVIISTYHASQTEILKNCIKKNINVFVEKPGGISAEKTRKLIKIKSNSIVRVGYNHRLYEAFVLAKSIIEKKKIGEILYIRAIYGHGGRINYNKEWRFNKKLSGGGELIDKGSHLIDLSRFFLGNLELNKADLKIFFWKSKVEDNCFFSLKNSKKQYCYLQASSTEWKNNFIFEIFCKFGKIEISGLSNSYGNQKLILYKMSSKMGKPHKRIYNFKNNNLIKKEIDLLFEDLKFLKNNLPNLNEAYQNLKIINKIYKTNKIN